MISLASSDAHGLDLLVEFSNPLVENEGYTKELVNGTVGVTNVESEVPVVSVVTMVGVVSERLVPDEETLVEVGSVGGGGGIEAVREDEDGTLSLAAGSGTGAADGSEEGGIALTVAPEDGSSTAVPGGA